jgi:hypothetical protein
MSVQPRLVLKEPAKRNRYLQVLISLRPKRYRARIPEHLTAQLSKLRGAVALFEAGYSVGLGHDVPVDSGDNFTELSVTENCRGQSGDQSC